MNLEVTILSNLVYSEKYTRKVLPFLKSEYFTAREHKIIFLEIHEYVSQYDALPSLNALGIECQERTDLTEEQFKDVIGVLNVLSDDISDHDWLLDATEKWCQERAIYLSLMESVKIADGQDSKKDKGAIPQILSEALGVSFDQHVGHDYVSDAEARYDFYHRKEDKIPFDLSLFNKITKGGLPNKTLNIALAGTGVGKSLFMCHCASSALLQGKNVLYITLEMAEEKIAERIDANLLNIPIQKLSDFPKVMFEKKIAKLSEKILKENNFYDDEIKIISNAIKQHSFSKGKIPSTIEGKILQDSDRLDAIGAIGLARVFSFSGSNNRPFYDPDDPFSKNRVLNDNRWALDHFYEKLLTLEKKMNTKTGKNLAKKRTKILKNFLKELKNEI